MLGSLKGVESEKAQRTLSSLMRALLPSPSKGNLVERVGALTPLEQEILREVCGHLGLPNDGPAAEDVPLVLESLSKELSAVALSEADIENLESRAFDDEPSLETPRARPRVFISSSIDGLEYARAIQQYLEPYTIAQIWSEAKFNLGRPVLENLIRAASKFDFAVLVFTSADYLGTARARGFSRDNVAFEAGLFAGRLGTRRTFFVAPQDASSAMSDLAGISVIRYDPDIQSTGAIGPAAHEILNQIRTLGPVGSKEPRED